MSYPVTVVLRLMHLVLCRHHCLLLLLLLLLLLGNVVTSVGVTVAKVLHFDLRLNLGQVGRRGRCGGHSLHLYGHHARGARKQRKSLSQPWANHKRHGESTKFVSSFLLPFLCFSATLRRSTGGRVSSRKCSHAAWFRTHDDEHGGGGRGGGNGSARRQQGREGEATDALQWQRRRRRRQHLPFRARNVGTRSLVAWLTPM